CAAVGVLRLVRGIGATTAIFSVVYATLFEPMSYPNPDQLVMVWSRNKGGRNSNSPGDYLEWKKRSTSFQYLEAWTGNSFNIAAADHPVQVQGSIMTTAFKALRGIPILPARASRPEDGQLGKDNVVILTPRLWSRQFGSDRDIVGRDIRLNGEPYTVVGVTAPGAAD